MFDRLVFQKHSKMEHRFGEVSPKLHKARLGEVNYVALFVYIGLLRALDAVTKGNTILSFDKYTRAILFVVFIPESTRVDAKHLCKIAKYLREDSHRLILTVVHRVLGSI